MRPLRASHRLLTAFGILITICAWMNAQTAPPQSPHDQASATPQGENPVRWLPIVRARKNNDDCQETTPCDYVKVEFMTNPLASASGCDCGSTAGEDEKRLVFGVLDSDDYAGQIGVTTLRVDPPQATAQVFLQ